MKTKTVLFASLLIALSLPTTARAAPLECMGEQVTIQGTSGPDVLPGTPGRDVIAGRGGADLISGGAGNDLICGGGGDDRLFGEDGQDKVKGNNMNDLVSGGPGDDVLDGGRRFHEDLEWIDTVTFVESSQGVVVDAERGTAQGEGADRLSYFEAIEGSEHDDAIDGGGVATLLRGLAGNDHLIGGGWNDVFEGGPGDDFMEGGNDISEAGGGNNVVSYTSASLGIEVDLAAGTAVGEGIDRLVDMSHVIGSAHDDVLRGNDYDNGLYAGPGNDFLDGRGAFDIVIGEEGNDVMHGGADRDQLLDGVSGGKSSGDDELYGEGGDDDLFIDGGSDLYDGGPGTEILLYRPVEGLVIDLAKGTISGDGNGDDRLAGIEGAGDPGHAEGGSVTLIGDEGPNRLTGGPANDLIPATGETTSYREEPVMTSSMAGRGSTMRMAVAGPTCATPLRRWLRVRAE